MVLLDLVSDPLLQLEELSLGSPARHLDHKREVAHVQHHGEGLRSASEGEAHLACYQCIIRYMKKLIFVPKTIQMLTHTQSTNTVAAELLVLH